MSNVTVSMKMSPKQAGALYMKNIELQERLEKAQALFSELYQVLGAHDADTLALDICSDASKGVFRVDELLPYFVVGS